jgi:hypothetical protein
LEKVIPKQITEERTIQIMGAKSLIWKSFDLWSLFNCILTPFPLKWDRKLKLFKELEGSRLKLIPWLSTIPLVFIPFILGSILYFLRAIQKGRSSSSGENIDLLRFYMEVLIVSLVIVTSILALAVMIVYFQYGRNLLISFNFIKEFHEKLHFGTGTPENERKGFSIALIIVVFYTLGIAPQVFIPQFTYMNLDPCYLFLRSTGLVGILDPESYGEDYYWLFILSKCFRGFILWLGAIETLRMTMLYCIIGLVVPIMFNDCVITIENQYTKGGLFSSIFHGVSSSKTITYIRMYTELQIARQNMAQAQALGSTSILFVTFIIMLIGNFTLVRTLDVLPAYFLLNIMSGVMTSGFSVYFCMQVSMVFHENSINLIKRWRDTISQMGTSRKKFVYKRSLALRPLKWYIGTGVYSHNLCVMDRNFKKGYFMQIIDRTVSALLAIPN